MRGIELLTHRIRAENRGQWGARLENLHRRQRARIGENNARAVVEIENEAREAWKLFRGG